MKGLFKKYVQDLSEVARHGDAREESFYGSLSGVFKEYAEAKDMSHVHVTTLPKSTVAGNPDFRVWNGQNSIIGYIEAKKPTERKA